MMSSINDNFGSYDEFKDYIFRGKDNNNNDQKETSFISREEEILMA